MRYRQLNKKCCFAVAVLLGMGVWVCARAVAQKAPTLVGILQQLQENLNQYDSAVPSFFCEEHVVSSAHSQRSSGSSHTVTDSTFYLKRIPRPDERMNLEESREVKRVNGKPATGDLIGGTLYPHGAFSNDLALVSLSQQVCMDYSLKSIDPGHSEDPILVEFASVAAGERSTACLMQEDLSGRVLIDPETMQVTQMRFHAPHHMIGTVMGSWDVTVEYGPVVLGAERFWLPERISESMADRLLSWTYDATYRNYHKMEVTSRILPIEETPAP
jgi:hypothetical protein